MLTNPWDFRTSKGGTIPERSQDAAKWARSARDPEQMVTEVDKKAQWRRIKWFSWHGEGQQILKDKH